MRSSNNVILILDADSEIGLALAEDFTNNDNEIYLCGKDMTPLQLEQSVLGEAHIRQLDIADKAQAKAFIEWASDIPHLNMVVNVATDKPFFRFEEAEVLEASLEHEMVSAILNISSQETRNEVRDLSGALRERLVKTRVFEIIAPPKTHKSEAAQKTKQLGSKRSIIAETVAQETLRALVDDDYVVQVNEKSAEPKGEA